MMDKNLILDEIVVIENIGEKETYDFNMPTQCFFAQSFLVHNSDTVLLLHWQNFYDHKADNENIFKILVAKQRNGRTGDYLLFYEPKYYRFYDERPQKAVDEPFEKVKEIFAGREWLGKANE